MERALSRRQEVALVVAVFVAAMAVAAAFWAVLPADYRENQSTDYLNVYEPVARAILAGRGVTLDGEIATRYPPGFSVLLAGTFGLADATGVSDDAALLVMRLASVGLAAMLVYGLARLVWSPLLALIPAAAWATYPFFLYLTKQPNSEVPFIPFLLATLFVFWLAVLRRPRAWWLYLIAGALAGLTMLIRPAALGLGGVMAVLVLLLAGRGVAWRARLAFAGLILAGNLLVVLPWEAAVYARTEEVILLSSGGTITVQDGLTFLAIPKDYRREVEVPADVAAMMRSFHDRRPEMATYGGLAAVVLDEARGAPLAFGRLMFIKLSRSWYGIDSRILELPTLVLQGVYLALILWGSAYAFRRGGRLRQMILGNWLIVLYFWAMTILVVPLLRYMVPAVSLLVIALPGVYLSLRTRWAARPAPLRGSVRSDF